MHPACLWHPAGGLAFISAATHLAEPHSLFSEWVLAPPQPTWPPLSRISRFRQPPRGKDMAGLERLDLRFPLHGRRASHPTVIRVYDEACKLIEVHRHKGDFKKYDRPADCCRCRIGPRIRRIQ